MKKVLVVDDSETIRQHVADALTRVGFQVIKRVTAPRACNAPSSTTFR